MYLRKNLIEKMGYDSEEKTLALSTCSSEYTAVDVKLSVEVKLEGQLPEAEEEYYIQLKAEGDCPMPEGAEKGIYTIIVPGGGKTTFPTISFSKVGVYEYTIIQIPGENETCTYDTTTCHVFVYVTNGRNDTLEVTVIVYENDTTRKSDDILFVNKYKEDILPENPRILQQLIPVMIRRLCNGHCLLLVAW